MEPSGRMATVAAFAWKPHALQSGDGERGTADERGPFGTSA